MMHYIVQTESGALICKFHHNGIGQGLYSKYLKSIMTQKTNQSDSIQA